MLQLVATEQPDKLAKPKLSTVGQSGHTSDFVRDLAAAGGRKTPRKRIQRGVRGQVVRVLRHRTACDARNPRGNVSRPSPARAVWRRTRPRAGRLRQAG